MIQYRKALMSDLDFLVELRLRDLKLFSDQEVHQEARATMRSFYKNGLQNQTLINLLGYDGEAFIASATVYLYQIMPSNENPRGTVGQFTNVWVDDDYRHQGIASEMIKGLIDEIKEQVGMICLNSSDDGIELYKKLGFKKKENYFVLYTE